MFGSGWPGLADSDPGRARRSTQSPEDVVRMLLLAAPDAGRPPPEIVGAALKAAGVPVTDQSLAASAVCLVGLRNVIRALEEASEGLAEAVAANSASAGRHGWLEFEGL